MQRESLSIGDDCRIDPTVLFKHAGVDGLARPIKIGHGVRIEAHAVIYGGCELGDRVIVEENCIIGKPEWGYAVGRTYSGELARTSVGSGTVVRAGACVYSGVELGPSVHIGHNSVVRTGTSIGAHSQIAHMVSIERECSLGQYVRCSPLSHLTSGVIAEDRVFLGAGVITINDRSMFWREPDGSLPDLNPPYFEYGSRVGSGSTVSAGVRVGREALVGSGSIVTKDVPTRAVALGNPARVVRYRD